MKTLNDLIDKGLDWDTTTFVVVAPNAKTRKLELHVHLPQEYLDQVQKALNLTIDRMKEGRDDLH